MMEKNLTIRISENGHQFFVDSTINNKTQIEKIFYSEDKAKDYIKKQGKK